MWRNEYSLVRWALCTCWKGGNWRLVVCLIVLLEILNVLRVPEEGGDILHLVMLLAHLLEPLMLSSLFGAEPYQLLVIVAAAVAINVHSPGSLLEFVFRNCFFGLPKRESRDVFLALDLSSTRMASSGRNPVDSIQVNLVRVDGPRFLALVTVVFEVGWILGGVIMFGIRRLRLCDLHGARTLLLSKIQVGLVPFESLAILGVLGVTVGAGRASATTTKTRRAAGGGGRSAMARVVFGIGDSQLARVLGSRGI